jgi:NitT/TauT family transport system substrate-binding protein
VIGRRAVLTGGAALAATPVRAAGQEVRLSHGYGIHYLPMMVIRDQQLLEKHAVKAGLGTVTTTWRILDGGSTINDAMLSGALDIAGTGAPGFITLWAKALNVPTASVVGVTALGAGALWLNTNKASIKTLRDFGPGDKIAVPGIKTSFAAIVLQMACAKEFGLENYAKLDPLTVSLPHPDAMIALTSGKTEVDAHFASPPFSNQELTFPNVHRVISTADMLGPITIDVSYAPRRFADAHPGLIAAFIAAMDEADAFIAADRKGAADAFVRVSGVKMPAALIDTMLADPETRFTTAPDGVMAYANFLSAAGLIKVKPASWSELFVPQMSGRAGS